MGCNSFNFQNNLCGVSILFGSVENAEIEDSSEPIPTLRLIHQTVPEYYHLAGPSVMMEAHWHWKEVKARTCRR